MLLANKVPHGSMGHHFSTATRTEAAMQLFNCATPIFGETANTPRRLRAIPATIQGVVQRLDYVRRELRVIAQDRVWVFVLPVGCEVYFSSAPAALRCIHPLDPIAVDFEYWGAKCVARIVTAWEPTPTEPD
jgi:hypothetical protein